MIKSINFSLFFKINLALSTIIALFFMQYNSNYTIIEAILTIFGIISTTLTLYIIIYIILFPFTIMKWSRNFVLYLSLIIFAIINISMIMDIFIYRLYKFHINAMVLNILSSPDALDSIQIGIFPIALFILSVLGFMVGQIFIIKKLQNIDIKIKRAINRKINRYITTPLILIVISEKVSYGMVSLYENNNIVSKFQVIPLYQPLTFSKFAVKYFGYDIEKQQNNTIDKNAKLNYPHANIEIKPNPNKINIFIFASDAVRASIVTPKIAPNIERFKQDSIILKHHYSGGNATRFGIFSLMYGLNSTYWFPFVDAHRGSILFDVLKKLNYNINIISSTNTNWPEFRKTCYVNIQDRIKDDFKGEPWKKDKLNQKYFLSMIDKYNKKKPIFTFLFFDSPHGYSSPPSFNHFHSKKREINYLTIKKDSEDLKELFLDYKNSVAYNDKLFGEMIKKLKDKGLYKNSIIIYTSDHGQEFFEYGSFGHNSSFSKAQTITPMIIKLPDSLKNSIELPNKYPNILTSHIDIVPTLLSLIGVSNPTSDYSNGQNLFSKNYHRDYVFTANWNNNAIITEKLTYVFSNLPNKIFKNEIRKNNDYTKIKNIKADSKKVLSIMNENRRFLK